LHFEHSDSQQEWTVCPWETNSELERDDEAVLCTVEDITVQVVTDLMKWV